MISKYLNYKTTNTAVYTVFQYSTPTVWLRDPSVVHCKKILTFHCVNDTQNGPYTATVSETPVFECTSHSILCC